MDAVIYLKAKAKMTDECKIYCDDCLLYGNEQGCLDNYEPAQAVAIVEKWLSEHPPVTYASKMREVFPKFSHAEICLADAINKTGNDLDCDNHTCFDCWNREYGSLE